VKKFSFLAIIFAVGIFSGREAGAITPDKAEFRKLADDVYAYIGKSNDANALIVATLQGVVVIDTGNNQPETRAILKNIQAVTQQPVRFVVITQNHGDHIGGTPLLSPPATVILHERVAKEWKNWKPHLVKAWRSVSLNGKRR
jgi:glyoxylase-like metal-dependent hydrolase (beta-lactamase superfamily II)